CWAMRLEHVGQDDEARARWLDAEEQLAAALTDPRIGALPGALIRANRALVLARLGDAPAARRCLEESRDAPAPPAPSLLRRRRARQLEFDALSDPLTQVPNRRAFDASLPRLVGDAQAAGSPLTLAIIDVDRFKRVNDAHGHLLGDEVLKAVAQVLQDHTRTA